MAVTSNKFIYFRALRLLLASGLLLGASSVLADHRLPEIINMIPDEIYIPPGFDDNDHAQVVVSGNFPNSCYKVAPAKSKVDHTKKKIVLENQVYYYPTGWCLQVIVPFSQTIELGVLEAGTYEVLAIDNGGKSKSMGKISISKSANAGPDDFVYAAVSDAHVEWATDGPYLVVDGTLGNECMSLKEVKMVRSTGNVLEVFPLVEVKSNTLCKQVPYPFQAKVKIEGRNLTKTLIHVRSLNGQSVNKLIEF